MPISKELIQQQINSLIENTKSLDQAESQAEFATSLASIIEQAIKSATVTVAPGIPVATTGGAGATTGTGTGTLS